MEKSSGVLQKYSLESELGRVEAKHAEDYDCQYEGDNGNCYFPAVVRVVVTNIRSSLRRPAHQYYNAQGNQDQRGSDVCDMRRNTGQEVN